jgi:hypothetical protein
MYMRHIARNRERDGFARPRCCQQEKMLKMTEGGGSPFAVRIGEEGTLITRHVRLCRAAEEISRMRKLVE